MITIIDYGVGNLGSIENMLNYLGIDSLITSDIKKIENSKKILLPGVGAYDTAMDKLNDLGFTDLIKEKVMQDKTPILGICLGMQLLLEKSEEGKIDGFGFVEGEAIKFKDKKLKIPHMGWNHVDVNKGEIEDNLFTDELRFYFVHSYYAKLKRKEDVWMSTNYGCNFTSAIWKDNIFGVQFHPEKSHKFGMEIFKKFNRI